MSGESRTCLRRGDDVPGTHSFSDRCSLAWVCFDATQDSLRPIAQKLIGKSQAHILECAEKPVTRTSYGQGVVLRYYKEASMFEESLPFLKGSQSGIHHGCWARVLIENERVMGIRISNGPRSSEETW